LFVLQVKLLHADPTGAHSVVVAKLRHFNEVIRTVLANGCPTLSTVVLSLQETEERVTDKAIRHFFSTPKRSLGYFQRLNPDRITFNPLLKFPTTNLCAAPCYSPRDTDLQSLENMFILDVLHV
jgi:hypothetical protein